RTTAPTESRSRLSASANVLFGSSIISPCMTSARPWMRTIPSDTEVTEPSLRDSADSLTFSMRVLISSLISDGLSWVVAIFFSWLGGSDPPSRSADIVRPRVAFSVGQCALEPLELALERTIDHHVARIDHRAADQRRINRRLDLDLAAEATLEAGADRLELGRRQFACGGDTRLDDLLGLGPQLLEQARDLRQQHQAVVVGEQADEALQLLVGTVGGEQGDRVVVGELRVRQQRLHARVGRDLRGERER